MFGCEDNAKTKSDCKFAFSYQKQSLSDLLKLTKPSAILLPHLEGDGEDKSEVGVVARAKSVKAYYKTSDS